MSLSQQGQGQGQGQEESTKPSRDNAKDKKEKDSAKIGKEEEKKKKKKKKRRRRTQFALLAVKWPLDTTRRTSRCADGTTSRRSGGEAAADIQTPSMPSMPDLASRRHRNATSPSKESRKRRKPAKEKAKKKIGKRARTRTRTVTRTVRSMRTAEETKRDVREKKKRRKGDKDKDWARTKQRSVIADTSSSMGKMGQLMHLLRMTAMMTVTMHLSTLTRGGPQSHRDEDSWTCIETARWMMGAEPSYDDIHEKKRRRAELKWKEEDYNKTLQKPAGPTEA